MVIAVLIKRVPDTASVFGISEDGKTATSSNPKFVMNPYDEHAVEEALRLREQEGGEVVVISAGPPGSQEVIRAALAMGADSGVLITGVEGLTAKGLSVVLAAGLKSVSANIVFAGRQAVDSDGSQVPDRVAEILNLPHVSCITRFVLTQGKARVDREIEGGRYTFEVSLPALFTTQKGINTPRYPTLPNIMKAKRKPITERTVESLKVSRTSLAPGLSLNALSLPRQNRLRKIIEGEPFHQVQELFHALREKEKVLP